MFAAISGGQCCLLSPGDYIVITTQPEIRTLKTKLVRIGNSRGVRLPKPLIEEAELGDDVELRVHEGSIIVSRSDRSRQGWAEAAAALAMQEEVFLDPPTPTRFDDEEWEW